MKAQYGKSFVLAYIEWMRDTTSALFNIGIIKRFNALEKYPALLSTLDIFKEKRPSQNILTKVGYDRSSVKKNL